MSNQPLTLEDWQQFFRDHIEEARCAVMTDRDREALIEYLKENAELIYFSPFLGLLEGGV
jgi:hypothetical protein